MVMDKETVGTVLSVAKQWWLKVNALSQLFLQFKKQSGSSQIVDPNSPTVICLTGSISGLQQSKTGGDFLSCFFYDLM